MNNIRILYSRNGLKLNRNKFDLNSSEVLIRVKSCGICGSDLKIIKYGSPRVNDNTVLGHELSGVLLNPISLKPMKNIILGADIPNKMNKDFAIGHEIHGGFQKYLILDKSIFSKIPKFLTSKKINFDNAALCEPIACCINGFKQMSFKKNRNVIIFGAGPIGFILAKLAIYFKSKNVFIIDTNSNRLKFKINYKNLFKLNYKNYQKEITKILKKKEQIDYGFVACNSGVVQNEILSIVKKGGTINYFAGLKKNKKKIKVNLDTNLIHYKQLRIVGSHGSTKKDIIEAAKIIVNKKINFSKIISDKFKIHDFKKAFKKFESGQSLKVILNP